MFLEEPLIASRHGNLANMIWLYGQFILMTSVPPDFCSWQSQWLHVGTFLSNLLILSKWWDTIPPRWRFNLVIRVTMLLPISEAPTLRGLRRRRMLWLAVGSVMLIKSDVSHTVPLVAGCARHHRDPITAAMWWTSWGRKADSRG